MIFNRIKRSKVEAYKIDSRELSIADYSVEVQGFPEDTDEEDLNRFFNSLYNFE